MLGFRLRGDVTAPQSAPAFDPQRALGVPRTRKIGLLGDGFVCYHIGVPPVLRGCVRRQTQVGTEWFLAGLPEEEEDAERRALLVELEAALCAR